MIDLISMNFCGKSFLFVSKQS